MPGPQTEAIRCPLPDLFFGGARFGGKTDFLLGDFGGRADKYGADGFRGVLFRRTYDELTDVIARSKQLYAPLGWTYNESTHTWTAPNGAVLYLRYLDHDSDAEHYKGWNLQWLGFDEMDQWPDPRPIDKLWATLRSTRGVPCVRRCTGNPGGPGHVWIKRRYRPHKLKPGNLAVFTRYQPQPEEAPQLWINAVFYRALLEDNRFIEASDYEARVAAAAGGNRQLFKAWRHGDWDVLAGAYFDCFDAGKHVIDARELKIEPWHTRWISGDWGFNDQTAIYWHAMDDERRVVTYRERVFNKTISTDIGRIIRDASRIGTSEPASYERLGAFYFSPDVFKPGAERGIPEEIGDVLRDAGLPAPQKAVDDRISGWQLLYQLLVSGHWRISDACPYLIEAMPLMLRDEKDTNDIADHPMDHGPDAARYGLKSHFTPADEPKEIKIARRITAPLDCPTDRVMQALKAEHDLNKPAQYRPNKRRYF